MWTQKWDGTYFELSKSKDKVVAAVMTLNSKARFLRGL